MIGYGNAVPRTAERQMRPINNPVFKSRPPLPSWQATNSGNERQLGRLYTGPAIWKLYAPVIDTMLAARAINRDLYLVTRNVRDTRPSGATIFDPWNDDAEKFPLSPRGR